MERLPKVVNKSRKRIGRGYGSGKGGHTVGFGQKGQKVRGKVGVLFEGVKVKKSLLRRLPIVRGKDKFHRKPKPIIINLYYLNLLKDGSLVNIESLSKAGIVKRDDAEKFGVKILGDGKLQKKLEVDLPTSRSAASKIEKAGGKIIK
jgi:large subunit ribosomal protein L15